MGELDGVKYFRTEGNAGSMMSGFKACCGYSEFLKNRRKMLFQVFEPHEYS